MLKLLNVVEAVESVVEAVESVDFHVEVDDCC